MIFVKDNFVQLDIGDKAPLMMSKQLVGNLIKHRLGFADKCPLYPQSIPLLNPRAIVFAIHIEDDPSGIIPNNKLGGIDFPNHENHNLLA
jgi:hypothetical protein